jgi:putative ABC transport system ATP-binding protein
LSAKKLVASRLDEDGQSSPVLEDVSLDVAAGELLAIVGPSGSGKSTFLRLLNRLLEPESGEILLDGKDIRAFDPPELRAQLPLVTQKPFLFPGTVRHNLEMPAKLRGDAIPDLQTTAAHNLFAMCQVDADWLNRDARKLSVGQQQRICLMRALLGPCKVLLLDEPTSALDRQTADQLAQTFRTLSKEQGLAIVVVTHDLRVAELCADQVALLQEGRVVEAGPAAQVIHKPNSEAARRFLSLDVTKDAGALI